jgi:uncharacterized protein YcfL
MKTAIASLAAALMICVVLPGCDTVNTYTSDSQNVTDSELNDVARVTNIRKSRVSGDLLRVQADVVNTDDDDEVFNYKFEWFDADGNMIDSPFSNWMRLQIGPRESITVTGTATSPKATDFKLKLILGKD